MLSPEEQKIAEFGKSQGKSKDEVIQAISKYRASQTAPKPGPQTAEPQQTGIMNTVKDLGIGFAKGAGATVNALQKPGALIQKALDPTEDNRFSANETIFDEEKLKATNTTQKVGKGIEFVAEVLFPTGLATKGVRAAGATLKGAGSRISNLKDVAPELRDKALDLLTGLDDKTKTALERTTPEVFTDFLERGRKAMLDDRNRTPLEAVGDSVAEALKAVKTKASEVGSKKAEFVKLPEAFKGNGITRFNEKLQSFRNSRNLIENDKTIVKQITQEFKGLGSTPTKGQVDRFIDFAQDALYAGEKNLTLPTSNKTTGALKKFVGELNEELKSQLPNSYRALNDEYSRLASLTGELNTKLGKASGNAGSLVKRLFSPSDARTKELFDQLEKETGKDFFRDARIAKFVMEALDDPRAASLLEQVPSSGRGLLERGFEYGVKKLADPIKAAERFIKKSATEVVPPPSTSGAGVKGAQNFSGAFGGLEKDEQGNTSFDPVNAMLMMAGIKAGSGKKQAIRDLVEQKSANLYLIKQRGTQLGEKVSKNLVNTLTKELKALQDELRKLSE